ncbi:MAG: prepilin peptidase [Chloroflexi bacterium]|nr:prepilin peptidase [Chloroflexota bacterium]
MTAGSILLLIAAMTYATVTDFRHGRIPNHLTFPMLAGGLILRTVADGQDGFLTGLGGAGVALAITFVPFVMNWMGAGDVKLAMVIGALMGWQFAVVALLYTAVVGGVIALAQMISRRQLVATLKYLFFFWYLPAPKEAAARFGFPYAPAMACGSAIALLLSYQPLAVSLQLPAFGLHLMAMSSRLSALGYQLSGIDPQLLAAGLKLVLG